MPLRFRYPTSLGSWVSRLHESSAVVNSCFKSSTKLVKNLLRSTCNATQAVAPVFGTGRLSMDICPPVNSDFVSTRTFALFNNIISAIQYCLSSASAFNQILNSAWGVTLPEQKKVPPTIALSLAFLRMPGLFVSAAARFVKSPIAHYQQTIDYNKAPQTFLRKRRLHSISSDDEYLLSNYWPVDFMSKATMRPCQLASRLTRC